MNKCVFEDAGSQLTFRIQNINNSGLELNEIAMESITKIKSLIIYLLLFALSACDHVGESNMSQSGDIDSIHNNNGKDNLLNVELIDSVDRSLFNVDSGNVIPLAFDEDWGEPFQLDNVIPYEKTKEDSLRDSNNKQIWADSVKVFELKVVDGQVLEIEKY